MSHHYHEHWPNWMVGRKRHLAPTWNQQLAEEEMWERSYTALGKRCLAAEEERDGLRKAAAEVIRLGDEFGDVNFGDFPDGWWGAFENLRALIALRRVYYGGPGDGVDV